MAYEPVAKLADLPLSAGYRVESSGEPICLVRLGEDTVKAVHDTCSHAQYSLAEGYVEDNEIECALHGSTFDLDSGEPQCLPATRAIPVYGCRVADGEVLVDAAQPLNDAAPPRH